MAPIRVATPGSIRKCHIAVKNANAKRALKKTKTRNTATSARNQRGKSANCIGILPSRSSPSGSIPAFDVLDIIAIGSRVATPWSAVTGRPGFMGDHTSPERVEINPGVRFQIKRQHLLVQSFSALDPQQSLGRVRGTERYGMSGGIIQA